jgi:hypothetical protein
MNRQTVKYNFFNNNNERRMKWIFCSGALGQDITCGGWTGQINLVVRQSSTYGAGASASCKLVRKRAARPRPRSSGGHKYGPCIIWGACRRTCSSNLYIHTYELGWWFFPFFSAHDMRRAIAANKSVHIYHQINHERGVDATREKGAL